MLWDCGPCSSHAEKFGGEVSWRSLSEMFTARRLHSAFDGRVTRAHCRIVAMCLPAAPALPIIRNEKFGTFSFYGQPSDKLSELCKILRLGPLRQPPKKGEKARS